MHTYRVSDQSKQVLLSLTPVGREKKNAYVSSQESFFCLLTARLVGAVYRKANKQQAGISLLLVEKRVPIA